jgi:hypothetical protein
LGHGFDFLLFVSDCIPLFNTKVVTVCKLRDYEAHPHSSTKVSNIRKITPTITVRFGQAPLEREG